MSRPRIVITGMGALSPNGLGREEFGAACRAGRSGVRRIERFDASALPVGIGGEVVGWDPATAMAARDLPRVSRAVPLALAASREALDDAGIDPAAMSLDASRRTAVVLGTGGGALDFSEAQFAHYFAGRVKQISAYNISSSTMGTMSSELSIAFGLRGPSMVVTSGCTSSTDALGTALDLLRAGRADRALVGGTDAPLMPGILAGFAVMQVLATRFLGEPERASRPFDRQRSGMVLGEGAWMLVLETLDGARARGARVHVELAGYGATCDAHHRVRSDPGGVESARAMTLALADAGVLPETVDAIALHGTGTELNDATETRAAHAALGARARSVPCNALKSMIGHPQGACGAAAVVAAVLGMRDGVWHPTINLEEADPACDLDYTPRAAREGLDLRTVLCNCLAFGSKNAALVLRRVE